MNSAESPVYLSFPAGTWFATRIRISVFFPLVMLLFAHRLQSLQLGLLAGAILFVCIILHEFGHIFAARLTGGYGDEILIWPLGGLAFCHPGYSMKSRLLTPAAGPIFHAFACLILAWPVHSMGYLGHVLNPMNAATMPSDIQTLSGQLVVLAFSINWLLMLLNLIPVYPLDGGRMLQVILSARLPAEASTQLYIRIGVIFGFGFLLIGMFVDSSTVVCLGALVLILNLQESFRMQSADRYDESFMGYDFSQGYTSLEREEEAAAAAGPRKNALQRWREGRAAKKAERERLQAVEEEQQLDDILAKLHQQGEASLTDRERKILKRVSERLREKEREA